MGVTCHQGSLSVHTWRLIQSEKRERSVHTHKWLHGSLQKDRFLLHGRGEEIREEAAKYISIAFEITYKNVSFKIILNFSLGMLRTVLNVNADCHFKQAASRLQQAPPQLEAC